MRRPGRSSRSFPGPRGGVNELAFHPDGRGSPSPARSLVEVWDLDTATKVRDLGGHTKWVYCVAFSPDGKWLATGGWDRTVKLWDADAGAEARDDLRARGVRPRPGLQPRRPQPRHDERGPERPALGGPLRPAPGGLPRPFRLRPGRRLPARWPGARDGGTGGVDPSSGTCGPSRPVVVEHTGWVDRLAFRRDGLRVLSEPGRYRAEADTTKGWNPLTGELDPALTGSPSRQTSPPDSWRAPASERRPPRAPTASWSPRSAPRQHRRAFAQQGVCDQLGRHPRCGDRPGGPHPDRPLGQRHLRGVQPGRPPARDGQRRPDDQALGHGDRAGRLHAPRPYRRRAQPGLQPRREPARLGGHRQHGPGLERDAAARQSDGGARRPLPERSSSCWRN